MKKEIILAGNIEQFNNYVDALEINRNSVVYGHNISSIRGVEASKVTVIGTFDERKDSIELFDEANSRIRK